MLSGECERTGCEMSLTKLPEPTYMYDNSCTCKAKSGPLIQIVFRIDCLLQCIWCYRGNSSSCVHMQKYMYVPNISLLVSVFPAVEDMLCKDLMLRHKPRRHWTWVQIHAVKQLQYVVWSPQKLYYLEKLCPLYQLVCSCAKIAVSSNIYVDTFAQVICQ